MCTVVLVLRSRLPDVVQRRFALRLAVGQAVQVGQSVRFLLSGRRLVTWVPLSVAAWMAQGLSLYLIVQALGHDLPVVTVVAIYSMSIMAGAASFIPGGIGATEAAIVLLLSACGVGQTEAISASFISRSLTLWLAIGIGVAAMTLTGLRARTGLPTQPRQTACIECVPEFVTGWQNGRLPTQELDLA